MKNKFKIVNIFFGVALLFTACSPKDYELGPRIDKSALKFTITPSSKNPNDIVLESLTPNLTPVWVTPLGQSIRVKDTINIAFPGTYKFVYGVESNGGYVQADTTSITITTIDQKAASDPMWIALTGGLNNSKTWVWATGNPNMGYNGTSALYGNGSEFMSGPEWWKGDAKELGDAGLYDEMKFSYNYVELVDKSDSSTIVSTTKGVFKLDGKTKSVSGHAIEGTLEFPFYPMGKKLDDPSKFANPYKFELVKFTADEMTLRLRGNGGGWGIIYVLKRKGYTYP